jgi:integrase
MRKCPLAPTTLYQYESWIMAIAHIMSPANWVREIKEKAGISFCLHDLRRTYITIAESCDIPYYALKAMLNHSLGNDVTGGYVCMSVDRLREPVQRVTERIFEMTKSSEKTVEGTLMEATAA